MPRFYFDVNDGTTIAHDEQGLDFSNLSAAEEEARQTLGEIAVDVLRGSTTPPVLSISIRDHSGQDLLSVTLTYAVVPHQAEDNARHG